MSCPSCSAAMEHRAFERKPHGNTQLDICFPCHAIWFDKFESMALTPKSVLELFDVIQKHRAPARAVSENSKCPLCSTRLQFTNDLQLTQRIAYYRCPRGHGRLSTFFQFMREKNFIRSLTPPELAHLRARGEIVRCTSCGAPVALERDAICGHCTAPVSILDADAVRRALAELDERDRRSKVIDPEAANKAALAGKRFEAELAKIEGRRPVPSPFDSHPLDLVSEALDFLLGRIIK